MTAKEIDEMANIVALRVVLNTKEVLTFEEAAVYAGVSKSWLYKKTMTGDIPHYEPCGKMIFFNRKELEQWLQQNHYGNDDNG